MGSSLWNPLPYDRAVSASQPPVGRALHCPVQPTRAGALLRRVARTIRRFVPAEARSPARRAQCKGSVGGKILRKSKFKLLLRFDKFDFI